MKVKKGNIEVVIDQIDLPKYLKAGWVKKIEVKPEVTRRRYLEKLAKERNDDECN